MALRRDKTLTLYDQIPALGCLPAQQSSGIARLIPLDYDAGLDRRGMNLKEGVNRIGRELGNDLVVSAAQVSRYHAELTVTGTEVWVRDLSSGNGTFVNQQRVSSSRLRPGDELGISPERNFRLVLDEQLEQPIGVELEFDAVAEPPELEEPTPPPDGTAVVDKEAGPGQPRRTMVEMERQRNVLAILYQLCLRCLMTANHREAEELLTNVLKRLVPLDSGFIVYQRDGAFRASIIPTQQRPPEAAVRDITRRALTLTEPQVLDSEAELARLGRECGVALVVPMRLDDNVVGVLCAMSNQPGAYEDAIQEVTLQLGHVAAAALVGRPA